MNFPLPTEEILIILFNGIVPAIALFFEILVNKGIRVGLTLIGLLCIGLGLYCQWDYRQKTNVLFDKKEKINQSEQRELNTKIKNLTNVTTSIRDSAKHATDYIVENQNKNDLSLKNQINTLNYKLDKAAIKLQIVEKASHDELLEKENTIIKLQVELQTAFNEFGKEGKGNVYLPYFLFKKDNNFVTGFLRSSSKTDNKNLKITYINFGELAENCTIAPEDNSISSQCFEKYSYRAGNFKTFPAGGDVPIDIPKLSKRSKKGKVLIQIETGGEVFYNEAIFKIEHDSIKQATRVIRMNKDSKHYTFWYVTNKYFNPNLINWTKEFPENVLPINLKRN